MIGLRSQDVLRLTLSMALLAGCVGCERPSSAKTGDGQSKSVPAVTKVESVRPARQTIRRIVEEPGQVEAFEVTSIYAKVAGYVRTWTVNIGSRIVKGQVMAELDIPEAVAEAEQKRAMVEQAEALRAQSEAAVKVAQANVSAADSKLVEAHAGVGRAAADVARWKSEHDRVEQLFRERAQTGSLLDETRSKLRSAESAVEEIEAHVKSAQAAVTLSRASLDRARSDVVAAEAGISVAKSDARRAEALLGYTRIVAPFDGVVTRRNVDTGHLTVPGGQGEPLFIVARSDLVTVTVGVPELFAAAVDPGDLARIRLQAIPGKTFEGKVTRTAYALDTKSRTLRVEIDLPNPDGKLHPGLYAYATIILDEHPDALTLPASAVGRDGAKAFCMGVRGGHAVRLPVEVGIGDGTRVEILSGLKDDEVVAKTNTGSLADSQSVELVEPATPQASGPKSL